MSSNPKILSAEKTKEIIELFYQDCLKFWKAEKVNHPEIDPVELAIRDVSILISNPFSPNIELLDVNELTKWINKNLKKQKEF